VDKARSREKGGTGLGLPIVKELLESYGGQVKVSSQLDHGTIFRVHLPIVENDK
jgi:signal transduction histidine kinase